MKKLLAVGLALVLSGCGGGFDDMDAARPGGGIGNHGSDKPTVPDKPSDKENWRYSSVTNSVGEVFHAEAENRSLNDYPDPKFQGLKVSSLLYIERDRIRPNGISESIKIFAGSEVSCTPTCQIPIKFNSGRQNYLMRYSTSNEILVPVNAQVGKDLFDKFTRSNSAVVTLPIVGLNSKVDVEFNLKGYDSRRMQLTIDSSGLAN